MKAVEKNFDCQLCKEKVESKPDLVRHFLSSHGKYLCPLCPNHISNSIVDLSKHGSDSHSVIKCDSCLKSFAHLEALWSHSKSPCLKVRYDCPLCDHAANSVDELNRHGEEHETFFCDNCLKSFPHLEALW